MCFFRKVVEPERIKPTSTEWAENGLIEKIIRAKFPDCELYLSDHEYLLCSYDDIALFLAQDETNKMDYLSDELDCDDFSYRLMGQFSIPDWSALAFGIIWTEGHAFNCCISEDRELLFIEPQTDEITDTCDDVVRFIIM